MFREGGKEICNIRNLAASLPHQCRIFLQIFCKFLSEILQHMSAWGKKNMESVIHLFYCVGPSFSPFPSSLCLCPTSVVIVGGCDRCLFQYNSCHTGRRMAPVFPYSLILPTRPAGSLVCALDIRRRLKSPIKCSTMLQEESNCWRMRPEMTLTARLTESAGMKSALWMGGKSLSVTLTPKSFKCFIEINVFMHFFLLQEKIKAIICEMIREGPEVTIIIKCKACLFSVGENL